MIAKVSDLEEAIIAGEKKLDTLIHSPLSKFLFDFPAPKHPTMLYDLTFPSPITFASFQGDTNQLEMWLRMGVGGGCFKTILKEPRTGNDRPRIVQEANYLINAYGLPGKGVEQFREDVSLSHLWAYNRPLGISIGGHTPEEYLEVFLALDLDPSLNYYYEVNISCPNTDEGRSLLKHPKLLHSLLEKMRQKTDKVIVVKLSPDQDDTDLKNFADVIKSIPKTAINIGNTTFKSHKGLSRGGGGQSGPPLLPRTLEMIKLLHNYEIPLIATGGISSPEDVQACLNAGARLVGMATALVMDPYIIPKINRKL